jgi:TonB family protein
VLVEFKLPVVTPTNTQPGVRPGGLRGGAPDRSGAAAALRPPDGFASVTGAVTDASGSRLPNVTVTATGKESGSSRVVLTNSNGEYSMTGLPSGTYSISAELPALQKSTFGDVRLGAGMSARLNFQLRPAGSASSFSSSSASASATQAVAPSAIESIDVVGAGVPDAMIADVRSQLQKFIGQPVSEGLLNEVKATVGQHDPWQFQLAPIRTPGGGTRLTVLFRNGSQLQPSRVRVGAIVASTNLIQRVEPVYPQAAKDAGIQGQVILEINISKEGKVGPISVVSGNPVLAQAAVDAVNLWVYKPTLLNGEPVDVITTTTLNFQ